MADDTESAVDLNQPKHVANDCDFRLAKEMTFDFYCLTFWEEFRDHSTVDQCSDRNLIQGLLCQKFLTESTERDHLVQFMQLIVCLTDGQEITTKYNLSPEAEETPLEKAVSFFDELVEGFEEEAEAVGEALKIQAVMVCMRAEDFGLAKKVHQRLWRESLTPTRGKHQKGTEEVLQRFIDQKKVGKKYLEQHTYEHFLEMAKSLLQKVYNQYSTPVLLKIVEAYRKSLERRKQALENTTEDTASIETSSSKQQATESSSPIKGFRHSERLSNELSSQGVTPDKNPSTPGKSNGREGSASKRGRQHHPAVASRLNGNKDRCRDNQQDMGNENEGQTSRGSNHGNQSLETNSGSVANQRRDRKIKRKGVKRKCPVVSSDSEEEQTNGYQETKEGDKATWPLSDGACRPYSGNLKVLEAVLGSCFGSVEVKDILSVPLRLPGTSKQRHHLRSHRRLGVEMSPSTLKSPPRNTSTPAQPPGRGQPRPSPAKNPIPTPIRERAQPKASTSDIDPPPKNTSTPAQPPDRLKPKPSPVKNPIQTPIRKQALPKKNTSNADPQPLGQVQQAPSPSKTSPAKSCKSQTTPKRGKSIRDQKYQPNRVKQRDPDAPGTSKGSRSPLSIDDSDSDMSLSPPVLTSPRVRRSLDPDTWHGNAALRQPPTRKKPWSEREVELLRKGLRRYGPGKWSEIVMAYDFRGRTNVNLKDKWRTMVKNGEI